MNDLEWMDLKMSGFRVRFRDVRGETRLDLANSDSDKMRPQNCRQNIKSCRIHNQKQSDRKRVKKKSFWKTSAKSCVHSRQKYRRYIRNTHLIRNQNLFLMFFKPVREPSRIQRWYRTCRQWTWPRRDCDPLAIWQSEKVGSNQKQTTSTTRTDMKSSFSRITKGFEQFMRESLNSNRVNNWFDFKHRISYLQQWLQRHIDARDTLVNLAQQRQLRVDVHEATRTHAQQRHLPHLSMEEKTRRTRNQYKDISSVRFENIRNKKALCEYVEQTIKNRDNLTATERIQRVLNSGGIRHRHGNTQQPAWHHRHHRQRSPRQRLCCAAWWWTDSRLPTVVQTLHTKTDLLWNKYFGKLESDKCKCKKGEVVGDKYLLAKHSAIEFVAKHDSERALIRGKNQMHLVHVRLWRGCALWWSRHFWTRSMMRRRRRVGWRWGWWRWSIRCIPKWWLWSADGNGRHATTHHVGRIGHNLKSHTVMLKNEHSW